MQLGRVSPSNSKLINTVSLASQLALRILTLPSQAGVIGGILYSLSFMWVSKGPNSSPHACTVNALKVEPSPQSPMIVLIVTEHYEVVPQCSVHQVRKPHCYKYYTIVETSHFLCGDSCSHSRLSSIPPLYPLERNHPEWPASHENMHQIPSLIEKFKCPGPWGRLPGHIYQEKKRTYHCRDSPHKESLR